MAVLDFVINLFSSQCDFHEDFFFGQNWKVLGNFEIHHSPRIHNIHLERNHFWPPVQKTFFRPPGRSEELHLFILKAECIAKSGDQILGSACPLRCPGRKFADALVVNELAIAINQMVTRWFDSWFHFVNSFDCDDKNCEWSYFNIILRIYTFHDFPNFEVGNFANLETWGSSFRVVNIIPSTCQWQTPATFWRRLCHILRF